MKEFGKIFAKKNSQGIEVKIFNFLFKNRKSNKDFQFTIQQNRNKTSKDFQFSFQNRNKFKSLNTRFW